MHLVATTELSHSTALNIAACFYVYIVITFTGGGTDRELTCVFCELINEDVNKNKNRVTYDIICITLRQLDNNASSTWQATVEC